MGHRAQVPGGDRSDGVTRDRNTSRANGRADAGGGFVTARGLGRYGPFPTPILTHYFTEAGDCYPYIAIYNTDTFFCLSRGATIARATLHNFPDIARKNLKVGSWVVVERAGDVIPRVVGLADTELCALDASDGDVGTLSTRSNLFVYSPPTQCPSCGSAARRAPIFNAQDSEGKGLSQSPH